MNTATLPMEQANRIKRGEKATKRERIVIDLNQDALKLFNELQLRTGASTKAELLRNLLKYAAAVIDEIDEGYTPLLMDKDKNIYKSNIHRILILE